MGESRCKLHGCQELGSYRSSNCTTGRSSRKDAAAQKCSFKRIVPVIATAAKTGSFARCIKHLGVQIGMQAAKRYARQNMELDGNKWAVGGV